MQIRRVLLSLALLWAPLPAQKATVRLAPAVSMPSLIDSNAPVWWRDGVWYSLSSSGRSTRSFGTVFPWEEDLDRVRVQSEKQNLWIESVWQDDDGTLFAWYHHEPGGLCNTPITAPKIGAMISRDNGETFQDLGVVLESGDPVDCEAQNGFFGSGHGDFTVILDRERQYFYFLLGNYGGAPESQGIALARMRFEDRFEPLNKVLKWHEGEFKEPGMGGQVTAVWQAKSAWQRPDYDSFWGPTIHWNTHLQKFVILMNRACCEPGWPQEGVYISYVDNLADPASWRTPERLMSSDELDDSLGYYVQVVGTEPGETDTLAGEEARLYIKGYSRWMIRFSNDEE
jgi:hypothetical protein